ncbi:MAG: restriction endonuclease subunit S [Clostridiales bacterium]|nr:restriction endonuclease subunit S [Clostridiales bacterium]
MNKRKVADLAKQVRGVSYKPEDLHSNLNRNSVVLLRANNIDDGKINFDDVVFVDKSKVSKEQYLQKGDILICASSGSKQLVGKAATFCCESECTFGAFCKVVRPAQEFTNYIAAYFQSSIYRKKISEVAIGANINNIRNEHIDSLEIPVGSNKENEKIVCVIQSLQAIIDFRKQELCTLDELIKARFVEMFEQGDYPQIEFGEICVFLRNGANIKQTKGAAGYPITRIETLANDVFNADRLGYADIFELGKYESYLLKQGDILISHINSVAYLGRAVQYRGQMASPIIHGMNLLCARIIEGYNPTYIEFFFKTPVAKEYISSITKKAVNQASITTSDLKKMRVPAPSLEKQNEFDRFVQQVDKSKAVAQKALDEAKLLFDSLMQKYFG